MILHSVFLRKECILPHSVEPRQESISDNWTIVGGLTATEFDRMIRHAGWHFMCLQSPYSRTGVGQTREEAIHQALNRALKGLANRFNAAELEMIQVSRFPLFHVATVTLQPRHIQRECSLLAAEDAHMRMA